MKNSPLHNWDLNISQARELQNQLSYRVVRSNRRLKPGLIAGIDVSISRFSHSGRAAIVVVGFPSMEIIEVSAVEGIINFPYIPGLLSFREIPLIMEAWQKLKARPELIMVDGQGIAHPRRFGIASHIGVLLDIPTIGCAKSRLIGEFNYLPDEAGSYSPIKDKNETVGAVVRTRRSIKPLYVSIGHKICLQNSILWVLKCCRGYRLPEPTRLAHLAAGGSLTNSICQTSKISIELSREK